MGQGATGTTSTVRGSRTHSRRRCVASLSALTSKIVATLFVLLMLTMSASRGLAAPPVAETPPSGSPPQSPPEPPAEIVKLEKIVSLELAHVRDSGPTEPLRRKQLFEAHELERKAEAAIKARDYNSAEDNLLKARVILRQLAQ
jgi:hypothetical protein